jgi:hypothetical protein
MNLPFIEKGTRPDENKEAALTVAYVNPYNYMSAISGKPEGKFIP